jgi:hypothetical protein
MRGVEGGTRQTLQATASTVAFCCGLKAVMPIDKKILSSDGLQRLQRALPHKRDEVFARFGRN